MQGGDDQDEGRDPFDGSEAHEGADAAREAGRVTRRAQRKGEADPLEGLAERIAAEGKPELAFDELVLDAALAVQSDDGPAFEELLRKLKGAKVRVTAWLDAIKQLRRRRKQESQSADRERQMKAAAERREARARELAAQQAEREAARDRADADRGEHFRGPRQLDEITYLMEPGRLWMEKILFAGTDRERTVQDTLAAFSAVLTEVVIDIDAPDVRPRPSLYTLAVVRGDGAPFKVEVPAEEWSRAEWPERFIPSPGVGPGGRSTREHLRAAIEALSNPTTRYRYRYVGWARHDGRPVYLHAGGAIDANGDVQGLRAEPPVARCARFTMPSLTDFHAGRDLGALAALFDHEPAAVVVPLLGHAFRAAMGDARNGVHVTGRSGLGKSVLIGVVAQCFGPTFSARSPLASWRGRGATVQGMLEIMASARDVILQYDDLQRHPESMAKATAVLPAHFNADAQIKGRRQGGSLSVTPSQGVIASSGETLPDEFSVRNRIFLLDLNEHPSPRLDVGPDCIKARGDRGELARGMARFLQWWAGRYDERRPDLSQMERDAAEAWGLGVDARAAEVLGAPALGLDAFFEFLADLGANPAEVASMRARAITALRDASGQHVEHVEEEANWRRFLQIVAEALQTGKGHAAYARRAGKKLVLGEPPPNHTVWGWRERQTHTTSTQGGSDSLTIFELGPTIAYLHADKPDKVLIAPGPALRVALALAKDDGRPLRIDVPALARELIASNVLTGISKGRAVGHAKWSWGSKDVEGFEVALVTLGFGLGESADDPPPSEPDTAPDSGSGPTPDDEPPP